MLLIADFEFCVKQKKHDTVLLHVHKLTFIVHEVSITDDDRPDSRKCNISPYI